MGSREQREKRSEGKRCVPSERLDNAQSETGDNPARRKWSISRWKSRLNYVR